tara:strand:- start:52919 stop:53872 length:954 start_codon:yes stop_codon:yes gene_type:complete
MHKEKKVLFNQLLNFFWLRPENALMLYLRSVSYRKTLKYFHEKDSTLDISCGDGVFSFLTFGGLLSNTTDMFRSIKYQKETARKIDNFDFFNRDYFVKILKKPHLHYTHGIDWKKNLLKKASKLNFYTNLHQQDNNNKFLFNNEKFGYVYSNSSYWVKNYDFHINQIIDCTKKNGHIVLQIKNNSALSFKSSKYIQKIFGKNFSNIIDAGRSNSWKFLKSFNEIYKIFQNNKKVEIIAIEPIYGDIMPEIWNFGLRPLFQPLSKMVSTLNEKNRLEIKNEFIQIVHGLFYKHLSNYKPNNDHHNKKEIEYTYILKKK